MNNVLKKHGLFDLAKSSSFLRLNRRKLLLFLIIYNCLMTFGHILIPAAPHVADLKNHSELAIKFGFPLVAAVYTFFVSIFIVVSICLIVPFVSNFKTSIYKLAVFFGLFWFIGLFEALFPEETYLDLLIIALNDAIPAFLFIFLIAKYCRHNHDSFIAEGNTVNIKSKRSFMPVITIVLSFISVRLIGYFQLNMRSRISDMPFEIIVWVCLLGLLVGFMYTIYQKIECCNSWLHSAIRFTFVLFGINWILFNLFIPLLLNEPFLDFIGYRAINDILAVFIGVICGNTIGQRIRL